MLEIRTEVNVAETGERTDADGMVTFRPGERITGELRFSLSSPPEELMLSLLFYTEGRASMYSETIDSTTWSNQGREGTVPFSFELPLSPYSFSGSLISVSYRLEAHAGAEEAILTVICSPSGKEISLHQFPYDDSENKSISDEPD